MPTPEGQPTTKRVYPLRDNMLGGVQTTLPAHLLQPNEWRTQHNFRLTPALTQVPCKKVYQTLGTESTLWMGLIPLRSGFGKLLLFTPTKVQDLLGNTYASGLVTDANFRRWAVAMYNSQFYYTNDLNPIRKNDGTLDAAISGAPKGRYLAFWYDHLVVGVPTVAGTTYPNRVLVSALGQFADATVTLSGGVTTLPAWSNLGRTGESTFYDFLEWQLPDYPFVGVTGIGKLKGTLWVYTPTAIIPMSYVGLPKVVQVEDRGVVTRVGNTFPWTLVCLDNVHFFYDGIEQMFWAFDGQELTPIGDAVRAYIQGHLNTDPTLAAKMYGYVDVDNREVWWPFVSTASSGAYDLAVVFNYRYKKWYTASVENVLCFCGGSNSILQVGQLTGQVGDLVGSVGNLGV